MFIKRVFKEEEEKNRRLHILFFIKKALRSRSLIVVYRILLSFLLENVKSD